MRALAYALITCGLLCGLLACKADIPSNVFACDDEHACPSGFICRTQGKETQRYCFTSAAGDSGAEPERNRDGGRTDDGGRGKPDSDAGVDAGSGGSGAPHELALSGAGFWSGGERRGADSYLLHDDGFDRGERACTTLRELCVTGGFSQ